jgi:hypothetical protein
LYGDPGLKARLNRSEPERSLADWFDPPASRSSTDGFSGQFASRDATTQPDAPAEMVSDALAESEHCLNVRLTTYYNEVESIFHRCHR